MVPCKGVRDLDVIEEQHLVARTGAHNEVDVLSAKGTLYRCHGLAMRGLVGFSGAFEGPVRGDRHALDSGFRDDGDGAGASTHVGG